MARKCFISFKMEDEAYKLAIQESPGLDIIDKSLGEAIDSDDEDYIMQVIRRDYLSDSTVTIHLIGAMSAESLGWTEQRFIKRELQASLYRGAGNTRSGVLGVVLPDVHERVFRGSYECLTCRASHRHVDVASNTVKEFSYNYYIPHGKCSHAEDHRYCVLVSWDDFAANPEQYIETAFAKRSHPISDKVKVYPKSDE